MRVRGLLSCPFTPTSALTGNIQLFQFWLKLLSWSIFWKQLAEKEEKYSELRFLAVNNNRSSEHKLSVNNLKFKNTENIFYSRGSNRISQVLSAEVGIAMQWMKPSPVTREVVQLVKPATCSSGILKQHFKSSSLLMNLGKWQSMSQLLGNLHHVGHSKSWLVLPGPARTDSRVGRWTIGWRFLSNSAFQISVLQKALLSFASSCCSVHLWSETVDRRSVSPLFHNYQIVLKSFCG